jgi:amidohydrolase
MSILPTLHSLIRGVEPELIALRRHLHAHPELSHREQETTQLLSGRIRQLGLSVHARPEGTGFYADLTPAGFDPAIHRTVAIRTDLDALPIH